LSEMLIDFLFLLICVKILIWRKELIRKPRQRFCKCKKPSKEELDLFNFKSQYLLNNPYFDFHEINCEDYFDKVFCRARP
jgi:hypothetical protein